MKIKETFLAIAIIVLTIFVTFYGINTLFPSHQYEDFCSEFKTAQVIENEEQCSTIGGKWNADNFARPVLVDDGIQPKIVGYCDRDFTCRGELDEARGDRALKVFFIALPLGIIIVLLGAFKFGLEAVGTGLMGGGVGTLVYGSGAYWPFTQNWVRFLLSLLGLVILIWFSYYFSRKGKKR